MIKLTGVRESEKRPGKKRPSRPPIAGRKTRRQRHQLYVVVFILPEQLLSATRCRVDYQRINAGVVALGESPDGRSREASLILNYIRLKRRRNVTRTKKKGENGIQKETPPSEIEPRAPRSQGQLPTCYPTLFRVLEYLESSKHHTEWWTSCRARPFTAQNLV